MSNTVLEIALPQCAAEDFDGEIVAINMDTGVYFGLKDTGAVLWRDLAAGHSVEALVELADGNAALAQSIERFVEDVLKGGLMRKATSASAPAQSPSLVPGAIGHACLPSVESFGDMKSLLLLDPIHEVDDDAGWPVRRQDS